MPPENGISIPAVLWDMDGTLLDSEPLWLEVEREIMAELGYQWQPSDQEECLGGPMLRIGLYMNSCVNNTKSPEYFAEELVKRMTAKIALQVPFALGAKDLLDALSSAGVPMALVTGSSRSILENALDSIGRGYFAFTISSDDVRHSKPDPEGYLKAAQLLGVDITSCIIIEDSNVGVRAGLAAGAKVIAVPHIEVIEAKNVILIKSLLDLDINKLTNIANGLAVVT